MKKELFRFVVIGCTSVFIDFIIYYLLSTFIETYIAKSISFLCGSVVSYFLNKYWTFEASKKINRDWLKFSLLYMSTLLINTGMNMLVLKITDVYLLAFLFATGVSTVLNFIGMKWWVFKK